MYIKLNFYLILTLISFLLVSGCKKNDDNPVSTDNQIKSKITLNGAGFSNKTFDLTGFGIYGSTENITSIVLTGQLQADSFHVFIFTPGAQTGTFNWQNVDEGNSGSLILFGSAIEADTFFGSDGSGGSTVVSEYNQVGQAISGTFSGPLISSQGNYLNVSGNFSVKRLPNE